MDNTSTGSAAVDWKFSSADWANITGYYTYLGNKIENSDFNATIVPEPSSVTLLGIGLLGLVAVVRRKIGNNG